MLLYALNTTVVVAITEMLLKCYSPVGENKRVRTEHVRLQQRVNMPNASNDHPTIVLRSAKSLTPHPLQAIYFRDANEAELQALAEDMLVNGQLVPVEILPDGTIICGHQRVKAAKLNKRKVRCWIRHDLAKLGDTAVERRFIQDNLHRRQLSKLEVARCYLRLKDLHSQQSPGGKPRGDLRDVCGKILGISGRQLDRLAKVLTTPPEVQKAFEAGHLTLQQVLRVGIVAPKKQDEIAEQIRAGKKPRVVVGHLAPPKPSRSDSLSQNVSNLFLTLQRQLELFEPVSVEAIQKKLRPQHATLAVKYVDWLNTIVECSAGR